jgi:hypothetical protein
MAPITGKLRLSRHNAFLNQGLSFRPLFSEVCSGGFVQWHSFTYRRDQDHI